MYDFQFPEGATRWDDPIPGVEGNGGWWMETIQWKM